MMKCYWIRKRKEMVEFVWWDGTMQSLVWMLSDWIRTYIIQENIPIRPITWDELLSIINNERKQKELSCKRYEKYGYDMNINTYRDVRCKRYEYLENNIDIWVKAVNILLNNMIVKNKMREIDYPDEQCTYNDLWYSDYLKTNRWNIIKTSALKRDGYRCVLCWSKDNLCWHHRSYKHKWKQDYELELNDVYILCDRCHRIFHDNINIEELQ